MSTFGPVYQMSEAGQRLLTRIVLDRPRGPQVLYDSWAAGEVSDADLPGLIPDTWLYFDWPEQVIGADKWIAMFRAAGYVSIPYGQPRPTRDLTVFRGAAVERSRGMSWTRDISRAQQFRQRHSWYALTAIYQATAAPLAVLALLERRGEGPPEIVVDPALLTGIHQCGPVHPKRERPAL